MSSDLAIIQQQPVAPAPVSRAKLAEALAQTNPEFIKQMALALQVSFETLTAFFHVCSLKFPLKKQQGKDKKPAEVKTPCFLLKISGSPGTGKTSLANALAAVLASTSNCVVLDMDVFRLALQGLILGHPPTVEERVSPLVIPDASDVVLLEVLSAMCASLSGDKELGVIFPSSLSMKKVKVAFNPCQTQVVWMVSQKCDYRKVADLCFERIIANPGRITTLPSMSFEEFFKVFKLHLSGIKSESEQAPLELSPFESIEQNVAKVCQHLVHSGVCPAAILDGLKLAEPSADASATAEPSVDAAASVLAVPKQPIKADSPGKVMFAGVKLNFQILLEYLEKHYPAIRKQWETEVLHRNQQIAINIAEQIETSLKGHEGSAVLEQAMPYLKEIPSALTDMRSFFTALEGPSAHMRGMNLISHGQTVMEISRLFNEIRKLLAPIGVRVPDHALIWQQELLPSLEELMEYLRKKGEFHITLKYGVSEYTLVLPSGEVIHLPEIRMTQFVLQKGKRIEQHCAIAFVASLQTCYVENCPGDCVKCKGGQAHVTAYTSGCPPLNAAKALEPDSVGYKCDLALPVSAMFGPAASTS